MLAMVLDYLAASLCLVGMFLVGNKKTVGWLINLACAISYMMLGIVLGLTGLVVLNVVMCSVHIRNYLKWRREGSAS